MVNKRPRIQVSSQQVILIGENDITMDGDCVALHGFEALPGIYTVYVEGEDECWYRANGLYYTNESSSILWALEG